MTSSKVKFIILSLLLGRPSLIFTQLTSYVLYVIVVFCPAAKVTPLVLLTLKTLTAVLVVPVGGRALTFPAAGLPVVLAGAPPQALLRGKFPRQRGVTRRLRVRLVGGILDGALFRRSPAAQLLRGGGRRYVPHGLLERHLLELYRLGAGR